MLAHQRVLRAVEVENTDDQDVERDQVEGDDLARERRTPQRQPAAPRPPLGQLCFLYTVGGDEIVPQDKIAILARSRIAHVYPLGQGHHSSL